MLHYFHLPESIHWVRKNTYARPVAWFRNTGIILRRVPDNCHPDSCPLGQLPTRTVAQKLRVDLQVCAITVEFLRQKYKTVAVKHQGRWVVPYTSPIISFQPPKSFHVFVCTPLTDSSSPLTVPRCRLGTYGTYDCRPDGLELVTRRTQRSGA